MRYHYQGGQLIIPISPCERRLGFGRKVRILEWGSFNVFNVSEACLSKRVWRIRAPVYIDIFKHWRRGVLMHQEHCDIIDGM
jgi:hypothetical protein